MAVRKAEATWKGTLKEGSGTMKLGSGAFEGAFTYASRYEEGSGTNPEELIGAAEAGCFSMAFSSNLSKAGFSPRSIFTKAQVHLEKVEGRNKITRITLDTEADVPEISPEKFQEIAERVKKTCPVSVALTGVEIDLNAHLNR